MCLDSPAFKRSLHFDFNHTTVKFCLCDIPTYQQSAQTCFWFCVRNFASLTTNRDNCLRWKDTDTSWLIFRPFLPLSELIGVISVGDYLPVCHSSDPVSRPGSPLSLSLAPLPQQIRPHSILVWCGLYPTEASWRGNEFCNLGRNSDCSALHQQPDACRRVLVPYKSFLAESQRQICYLEKSAGSGAGNSSHTVPPRLGRRCCRVNGHLDCRVVFPFSSWHVFLYITPTNTSRTQ